MDHRQSAISCISGEAVHKLSENDEMLEVARLAIENALVASREARLSEPLRGNGLVICEPDGTPSSVIRIGPESAMRIGLRAIADHLRAQADWS